jgi:hypothetical protein
VSLTVTANTLTAAGSVDFTATATDDVGVVKVELWDGFAKVAEANVPTTGNTWRFTRAFTAADDGVHRYVARAFDAAINSGVSSPPVLVNVLIQTPSGIKDIVGCAGVSFLLKNDGTVAYSGNSQFGLSGGANSPTFAPFFGLTGIAAIACTPVDSTALFLKSADGAVACLGANVGYACGAPLVNIGTSVPVLTAGVLGGTSVSLGGSSCIRKADGTVLCWSGYQGTPTINGTPNPVQVVDGDGGVFSNVDKLFGCPGATFARKADGSLWAWGLNDGPYLGAGFYSFRSQNTPVPVRYADNTLMGDVVEVVCGGSHRAVLVGDGGVFTFGYNTAAGELGNANAAVGTFNGAIPTLGLSGIVDVASGQSHTLALDSSGTVWAFGANDVGQLGNGTTGVGSAAPVQVQGLSNIVKVGAGQKSSLALRGDGALFGWGQAAGSGVDDAGTTVKVPVRVLGLGL